MEKRPSAKSKQGKTTNKKKYIIRTNFDPNYKGTEGEINNEKSKTVPNMSMDIRTLLDNHTRGILPQMHNYTGEYFDSEVPNYQDITEKMEAKKQLADDIKEVNREIKKQKEAREQALIDKARAEYRKELEDAQKPSETPSSASVKPITDQK